MYLVTQILRGRYRCVGTDIITQTKAVSREVANYSVGKSKTFRGQSYFAQNKTRFQSDFAVPKNILERQ